MTHAELLAAAREQLEGMTSGPVPEWVWNMSLPSLDLLEVCLMTEKKSAVDHVLAINDAAAAYVAALRTAVE